MCSDTQPEQNTHTYVYFKYILIPVEDRCVIFLFVSSFFFVLLTSQLSAVASKKKEKWSEVFEKQNVWVGYKH